MKKVVLILKTGNEIQTECADIGMEWNCDTGRLMHMELEKACPEVAYIDLNEVICVIVEELRDSRRRKTEGATGQVLRSAT